MTVSSLTFQSSSSKNRAVVQKDVFKLAEDYVDDMADSTDSGSDSDVSHSSYDDDDSDSSWDEEMDELMDWFNGAIVGAQPAASAMKRTTSMPVMRSQTIKPKLIGSLGGKSTSSIILSRLASCEAEYFQAPKSKGSSTVSKEEVSETPAECLKQIFLKNGLNVDDVKVPSHLFHEVTEAEIHAHSYDTTIAARRGDLSYLKNCLKEGKSLQCCNRFGESIVHIVCRRGTDQILKFLIEKAKVKVMVRDDVGRTPLHDAAWTASPNFKLVKMLLHQVPEMLHVKDSRNHTPLSYVPRQQWGEWCTFLKDNQELLVEGFKP